MRIIIKTDLYSVKHLQALMLQKDLTRKAVASDMGISVRWLGRAFELDSTEFRKRVIEFVEGID